MGDFDTWYSQNGQVSMPNLQAEWKDYMETVLSSMVLRTRATYDVRRAIALSQLNANNEADRVFIRHWAIDDLTNKARVRIIGSCDHLDRITV
ncbi:hypothetical protein ColLi_00140 [Colletotrichum liriopes]|uniref:Uncharacterized protein n=1 Tax=Colletotrichum liriopes TaxID=708192 RepID=A0AA37GAV2_9PEZI|nr:hypothetical protein ColLi_00140 [Colletotrichum liriopes]